MQNVQIDVYKGKKWEDVINEIQKRYEQYEILETNTIRHIPMFWIKEYQVKVTGLQKEQQKIEKTENKQMSDEELKQTFEEVENTYQENEEPVKEKEKTSGGFESDSHRNAILSMLEGDTVDFNEKKDEVVGQMERMKEQMSPEEEKQVDKIKENVENSDDIESMKKMIETLVNRMDRDNKGFLEGENEKVLAQCYDRLIQSEVDEKIAQQLIINVRKELTEGDMLNKRKVEQLLFERLEKAIDVTGDLELERTKTIALIGPTGVGKTTTLAKIAGILIGHNKRIGMITTDVYRIGATEQLQTYANILDCKMITATNPQELKDGIDYFENVEKVDHILIDTVGRSPMDTELIDDIKSYLDIVNPDHTGLVLSSTQKYSDIMKILENFSHVNISSLLFTKLDETMSYGPLLNVAYKSDYKISYLTDGQNVPQDIYLATSDTLASKILTEVKKNGSSSFSA